MKEKIEPDRVYGEYQEGSPVVTELMASKPIQRLKGLNQYGIPDRYYHLKGFSRFDHSLGVMLLLRHLGASEEEQVAGLLHDVSHRAFSHVYDWVVGTTGEENSQDDDHDRFIRNTEIPLILKRHGYDVARITDYHNFGLLERESPDLCADRVDYLLREIEPELAKEIFGGLMTFEGQIVCKDQETATELGQAFLTRQIEHWGGWEGTSRYYLLSSVLKSALGKGIIRKEDFLNNDDYIMGKLEGSSDKSILKVLSDLRHNPLQLEANGPTVKKKFRYIDPPFMVNGILIKLTGVNKDYAESLKRARQENQKGVTVPRFNEVSAYQIPGSV